MDLQSYSELILNSNSFSSFLLFNIQDLTFRSFLPPTLCQPKAPLDSRDRAFPVKILDIFQQIIIIYPFLATYLCSIDLVYPSGLCIIRISHHPPSMGSFNSSLSQQNNMSQPTISESANAELLTMSTKSHQLNQSGLERKVDIPEKNTDTMLGLKYNGMDSLLLLSLMASDKVSSSSAES